MKLNDRLSKELYNVLKKKFIEDESILYSLKSDLTRERQYGESYFIVTNKRIFVLGKGEIVLSLYFKEISKVKVDELFGSARLVAATKKGKKNLIFYSKAFVPQFAVLCRVINDILSDRHPELPEDEEFAYCVKCGAPLPERASRCPLCVSRIKIFTRLFSLIKPYKGRTILLILMTFVTVAAQMGPPYITKMIVDDVIIKKDHSFLLLWIGLMITCGILMLFARLVGGSLTAWFGARIVSDLRTNLHMVLQRLRMNYFSGRESGEIITRVMHDTNELQHFLIDGMPYFLVQSISFVAIAAVLIYLDAKLAMLVFFPVPFLVGGGGWFWKKLIPLFHKHGSKIGALHSILGESIRGVKTVKVLTGEKRRVYEFDGVNENLFGIQFTLERTFISFSEVMFWIMSLGVAAVWFFAARRIVNSDPYLSLGDLLAFVGYIWLFYGPLQWFTVVINWMTHAFSGAERIFALLDSREEVYDVPDAIVIPRIKGAVSFKDIYFSYERGKEIIKGISFDIAPGEMVGLVGKSGAGKSTIINLICRFYDVDSGLITIDSHSIKKIKLTRFRRQLGMVMQEPFLFNTSIMENIRYGTPEASFEDVIRAAKAANAHDFILNKEDGYDTIVGERGSRLSGGEKQRLVIARAILHDPAILILDEATSSVDTQTEKDIQEAMANLVRNRTTIAIAHRLSTLKNANRLIVIDDGKIVELGTHNELLSRGGIYANLVEMQAKLNQLKAEVWKG
jgi:ATP-binding cassette subfamily B protein